MAYASETDLRVIPDLDLYALGQWSPGPSAPAAIELINRAFLFPLRLSLS
jgi:hypothetical protein